MALPNLSVAIVQSSLHWEAPDANRAMFEEMIWGLQGTDIIVLPEMFTTGFSMNPGPLAEPMNLTTFKWMRQLSMHTGAALVGSYIVKEGGFYYNRLVWMQPDGQYECYDKRHLFRMAGEDKSYAAGKKKLIVSWRGWKICPLICYDLRFPVWSRNVDLAYDCLIYVANWPAPREEAWKLLARARAIENASYCLAVNRVGISPDGMIYNGHSAIIDFKGHTLVDAVSQQGVFSYTLNGEELQKYRDKFPVHLDADGFQIWD